MSDTLRREAIYLWYYFSLQLEQILPYWIGGLLLGSAISVFAREKIHGAVRSLGKKKIGVFGLAPAGILGIASPLCMYGTIPLAASLSRYGIPEDWLAAFMMSSILLNPQLMVYTAALGPTALLVRFFSCLFCGIAAGLLVRVFYKNKIFFRFDGFMEKAGRDTDPNLPLRFLKNIGRNIKATGFYFLTGIALSAIFQRYAPSGFASGLSGGNQGFGVLMAATLGVPLYACGGGAVPLLQAWLLDGMSMGSAAAFMLTGPATKITNLGALKIVFGVKRFMLYLLFVILFALFTGFVTNLAVVF